MATDVVMPQMGESIFEGTIVKWLKQPGERVEKDEPLLEISTDKVDVEIPAPVAGVLTEIRIQEGATVQVNTVLAVLAESGAPAGVAAPEPTRVAAPAPAAPKSAAPSGRPEPPVEPRSSAPAPEITTAPTPAAASEPESAGGTKVVMPQMGESIFEGTIAKWLKKVGERVEKDEPLLEISTDKVDAEIPAPVAGILTAIKAHEGDTVQVNTVIAVIGGRGAPASAAAPAAASSAASGPTPPANAAAPQAAPEPSASAAEAGGRIRTSPLVRRIARENRVDLARIAGTGLEGRITRDDILRHLDGSRSGAAAAAAPPMTGDVAPLSRMRAIIAERMVESKRISPHAHTVYKIDMTRVVRLRDRAKDAFEQRHGVKLTYLPFIAAAVVAALRKFPVVNASLRENAIHYHPHIGLGIAVSLEWGLIVPVVRQAEQCGFVQLARSIADLAGRARARKLTPDEVGGSTFTLTNSGIFGDEFSTPIINQPDAAILCLSGLKKEPVVLTDAEGNDTIAIRSMQHFTLGFDHRLIDGADACKFMLEVKRELESWDREIG